MHQPQHLTWGHKSLKKITNKKNLYIDFVSFWAGGSHIRINLLRPDLHKTQKPAGSCKSPSEYKRRGLRAVKGRLVKRQLLFEAVEIHWIFFKCLTTRVWGHVKICILIFCSFTTKDQVNIQVSFLSKAFLQPASTSYYPPQLITSSPDYFMARCNWL